MMRIRRYDCSVNSDITWHNSDPDITRSYIHSFSLNRNPITCFSLALCTYDSFTTNSYIFVRSTERALTAFEYFTHCCALIKWTLHSISGDTEISPNFPRESGWSVHCKAVAVISVQLQWLQTAKQECLLWSLHQMTAHENSKMISNLKFQRRLTFRRSTII